MEREKVSDQTIDECLHCTVRGDFDQCLATACNTHESWAFKQALSLIDRLDADIPSILEGIKPTSFEPDVKTALIEAVAAIYFDDNSDYASALWEVVKSLGGDEAVMLLGEDGAAAYKKYCE